MILAVKLKNAIKKEAANNNMELVFSLKNIIINGEKRGCSGFVRNVKNGSVIYVDTEKPVLSNLHYMYRYAEDEHDYRGYRNRWADTFEELVKDVCKCLTMTPEEARDTRI